MPETRKHRHAVTVSTEAVLSCAQSLPSGWTTHEIATRLSVSERAVRAAVQWLSVQCSIKECARTGKGSTKTYTVSSKDQSCDVGLLNRIVMRWA